MANHAQTVAVTANPNRTVTLDCAEIRVPNPARWIIDAGGTRCTTLTLTEENARALHARLGALLAELDKQGESHE